MYARNYYKVDSDRRIIWRMIGVGTFVALLWIGLFVLTALPAHAVEPKDIPAKLRGLADAHIHATVEVSLPMAADDRDQINYDIVALSCATPDTLLPVDYLVEWKLPAASGTSEGFTSYFDGNLYRFRDSRLREYHFDDNPDPFISGNGGVQRSTQFMDVLPYFLADEVNSVVTDPTYTFKWNENVMTDGVPAAVLRADREMNGEVVAELTYVFDPATMMPRKIIREMSPGNISEQTILVRYAEPSDSIMSRSVPRSEDEVMALYPEVFERFREKNYRLTSLPGQPVPNIALPSAAGGRYTHPRGEKFTAPTVIVFLDETVATTPEAVKAVRAGVASMPFTADIIWIFLSPRIEDATGVLPDGIQAGETLLTGGRNSLREFGVTETPSIIFANPSGLVSDVIVGYNKDLESGVIHKVALAK